MFGGDFEETQQLAVLFEEAELYLSSFHWCEGIKNAYFGLGVSDIIGIFLFEILSSEESMDKFHWVVAGDVPPACFAAADCPNSALALHSYIDETKNWCRTVLAGGVVDCGPKVSASATAENARELLNRISFLDTEILSRGQTAGSVERC
jgi:hypothetical protein